MLFRYFFDIAQFEKLPSQMGIFFSTIKKLPSAAQKKSSKMSITILAECDQGLFFQGHHGICQCESCPSKQFRKQRLEAANHRERFD